MLRMTAFGCSYTFLLAVIIGAFLADNWAKVAFVSAGTLGVLLLLGLIVHLATKPEPPEPIIPKPTPPKPSWRTDPVENAERYDAILAAIQTGKTQKQIAQKFGTYPSMVSRIKTGKVSKEEFFRLTS